MKTIHLIALIFLFAGASAFAQIGTLKATLSVKKINGISVPYQNGIPVPAFEKQTRQIINLQGEWKKERFTADPEITINARNDTGYAKLLTEAAGRNEVSFNDSGWENKVLPGVENTMNPLNHAPEYYEDGVYYRRHFTIPSGVNGKFIKLMFYSVNYVADVWLNDVYLGWHEGGFTPFAFDVSGALNYDGDNVLVVRVHNIPWGTRKDIVPYTEVDWFNYAGIVHDVYLEVTDPVSVVRANIVPLSTAGDLQTTVVVSNMSAVNKDVDIAVSIYEADINETNIAAERASDIIGVPAAVTGTLANTLTVGADTAGVWQVNLKVENPKLWSTLTPNLYVMKVTLTSGGSVVDEYYTQFGIRIFSNEENLFLLNGFPCFFTGVARHEDHPLYGRSIPVDSIYSDLKKVKEVNATYLRTAHYPNHLQTYILADRLGLVIMEEIPVWWFDDPQAWAFQNSVRQIHEQMFREMVFRDYNRPSIAMWSLCNECMDVNGRRTFIQKMNLELDQNYRDGRMITQSAAADRPGPEDPSMQVCDVAGWTLYYGVFYGDDAAVGTKYFLVDAQIANQNKPIIDTEFGTWSGETGIYTQNQIDIFNATFPTLAYRSPLKMNGSFNRQGFLMGATWWCIFDWYQHTNPHGYQSMGLLGMDRTTKKPIYNILKNAYFQYARWGGIVTDVSEDEGSGEIPDEFRLEQNYPNPFNPSTTIGFSLPVSGHVTISVYDVLGRKVAELINTEAQAGNHTIVFDTAQFSLASGIYLCKMQAGDFEASQKMMFLK